MQKTKVKEHGRSNPKSTMPILGDRGIKKYPPTSSKDGIPLKGFPAQIQRTECETPSHCWCFRFFGVYEKRWNATFWTLHTNFERWPWYSPEQGNKSATFQRIFLGWVVPTHAFWLYVYMSLGAKPCFGNLQIFSIVLMRYIHWKNFFGSLFTKKNTHRRHLPRRQPNHRRPKPKVSGNGNGFKKVELKIYIYSYTFGTPKVFVLNMWKNERKYSLRETYPKLKKTYGEWGPKPRCIYHIKIWENTLWFSNVLEKMSPPSFNPYIYGASNFLINLENALQHVFFRN